ncbi:unnamed protein product [Nezara viridula]|uniref:LITAF domain-containing protein n=1 Tax=Nezara viridula TaxID=85310 RepID=A0A9P0H605_NEZVI|nr:unnamed protein product [Nezara viridula]
MTCPHCNVRITTVTTRTNKTCTHLCCCCMFFSVICTLCSCLPYCCCDPESVEHTCPNCSARLGVYYS